MTIIELLEELKRNPEGQELLKTVKKPEDIEEYAAVLADISAHCGIEVNQAEILSMIQAEEAEMSRRYKAAQEEITQLSDDDVEDVVGGVYYYENSANNRPIGQYAVHTRVEGCRFDFTDNDCFYKDACNKVYFNYFGCYSGQFVDCEKQQDPIRV